MSQKYWAKKIQKSLLASKVDDVCCVPYTLYALSHTIETPDGDKNAVRNFLLSCRMFYLKRSRSQLSTSLNISPSFMHIIQPYL
uniref:Uncharacterized protein n=1 Tax=Setaria italica TaxID=4555 RepID=K3ZYL1_SETIT